MYDIKVYHACVQRVLHRKVSTLHFGAQYPNWDSTKCQSKNETFILADGETHNLKDTARDYQVLTGPS
jgi:hypothetical protein